jgi:hypothetical protein
MASPQISSLRTGKRTALEHPALCAGTLMHITCSYVSSLKDATMRRECLLSVSDDRPEKIGNECQVECRWLFHRYDPED